MVTWNWGLINGAADAEDDAALHVPELCGTTSAGPAWASVLRQHSSPSGLGGLRGAVLPEVVRDPRRIVFGGLSALGDAGAPPGGLVNYLLLPFWLITASIIMARRSRNPRRNVSPASFARPN